MGGILPATRGGLLIMVPVDDRGANEAMEDVELERVGDDGWPVVVIGGSCDGGEGAMDIGFDGVRWCWEWWLLLLLGKGGAILDVGVGFGVFSADKEVLCTGFTGSGMCT
jgi:hypothetical protein